jgi:hypothetical protein
VSILGYGAGKNPVYYRTQKLEVHRYFHPTDNAVYFSGEKRSKRESAFFI